VTHHRLSLAHGIGDHLGLHQLGLGGFQTGLDLICPGSLAISPDFSLIGAGLGGPLPAG
jgi:hypothetical protein